MLTLGPECLQTETAPPWPRQQTLKGSIALSAFMVQPSQTTTL